MAKDGSCHIVPAPYIFTAFDFALLGSQFGQIDTLAGGCFAMSDTFDASCRLPKSYEYVKVISRFLMCVGVGVGVGVERGVGENLRTAEKKDSLDYYDLQSGLVVLVFALFIAMPSRTERI